MNKDDLYWMEFAVELAVRAKNEDEVPIGAIVVRENKIIGKGWNSPISSCDPTCHAEINAIRDASKTIKNYRITNAALYVTLEPCIMCLGSILHARIEKVVFGAHDTRKDKIKYDLKKLNYGCIDDTIDSPSINTNCSDLLNDFFKSKR